MKASSASEVALARLLMGFLRSFAVIKKVPVIGSLLRKLGRVILPPATRVWVRIQRGPAAGLWLNINPRAGADLYRGGRERLVQETLAEHLKPGMVFYDLGANLGLFTIIGARRVGPEGKVFAFEPDPDVCNRLRQNVSRNGFSNVEVVQGAVYSTTGSSDFVRADPKITPDLGLGRIDRTSQLFGSIRIRTVALNDFVRDARLPDVIKCDVEGAEVDVFEGAGLLLERQRPAILCEVHSESNSRRITELLTHNGYTLRWLDESHFLALG